ncbi:MAG TPA: antibiotic biosynthesis monooxygenase [Bradyrhizobium sp.]|nr:antibiotic biosynthesis monooxygenase [Bradyrhizobium sp.]
MIARTWRATATHEKASIYQQHFANSVIPHLRTIEGFSGASLLRREIDDSVELVALTLWQSLDSIIAFTGPDPDKAIVDAEAQTMLTAFDKTAGNYEIVVDDRANAG